jgi:hypothetical protein
MGCDYPHEVAHDPAHTSLGLLSVEAVKAFHRDPKHEVVTQRCGIDVAFSRPSGKHPGGFGHDVGGIALHRRLRERWLQQASLSSMSLAVQYDQRVA